MPTAETTNWTPERLAEIATELEPKGPEATLEWMVEQFHPSLYLACSFQQEESVLLEMLSKVEPKARVFYIDTETLFPETLETRDRVIDKYDFEIVRVHNDTIEEDEKPFGGDLCQRQHEKCCQIRKVKPLEEVLSTVDGWITGIRRDQAPTRADSKKVEWDEKFGLVKANPLADWTLEDIWGYIREHDLIYNPLHDQNYPSIGCIHGTKAVAPGEDPRSGRWADTDKTECGLHE